MIKQIKTPILMIVAIVICLGMLRLGFWQLDRAEQKRVVLSQSIQASESQPINIENLLNDFQLDSSPLRFRPVTAKGHYLDSESIYIDNQVFESRVGYSLLTPLQLANSGHVVMVDRGWLPVGASRQTLPEYKTPLGEQNIYGRLNMLPAKPPLWNDEFAIVTGKVWQFLTTEEFREKTDLDILPLVLELAPVADAESRADAESDFDTPLPMVDWQTVDDEWVHKHQAYALQWFTMAVVFFIACLIVLSSSLRKPSKIDSNSDPDN